MRLRTKTRFAPAIRAAHPGLGGDDVAELTRTETFALTAIAYLQPVTRGEISKLAGREISRDVIAALKRHGLIDGAIRAPQPGAPFAYVTTRTFLEAFGLASLRDLPDLERLKAERPAAERAGGGRTSTARSDLRARGTTTAFFLATRSWMKRRQSEREGSKNSTGATPTYLQDGAKSGHERPLIKYIPA